MRRALLTLLFLAASLTATAAEWNEMDDLPSSYGVRVYLDNASYEAERAIRRAWVRMDYAKPREKEGYLLTRYVSHRIVNCDTRRYYITQSMGYIADRPDPVYFNHPNDQEWKLAVPDGESDIAMAIICTEPRNDFGNEED